jgi:hypothetical protein
MASAVASAPSRSSCGSRVSASTARRSGRWCDRRPADDWSCLEGATAGRARFASRSLSWPLKPVGSRAVSAAMKAAEDRCLFSDTTRSSRSSGEQSCGICSRSLNATTQLIRRIAKRSRSDRRVESWNEIRKQHVADERASQESRRAIGRLQRIKPCRRKVLRELVSPLGVRVCQRRCKGVKLCDRLRTTPRVMQLDAVGRADHAHRPRDSQPPVAITMRSP